MVRTYKPKTDRNNINEENIEDAIREVLSKTLSIRKAADKYGIKTATLQHRIEKARKLFEATRTLSTNEASSSLQAESSLSQAGPSSPQIAPSMEMAQIASSSAHTTTAALLSHTATATSSNIYGSKYTVAQVFSTEQEKALTQYLLNCSKMHYGLTLKQLLTLAYEYAESSGCNYPKSWKENKCAGKDWAAGFRKRNPELSLRKPENTSAARSFAFNKAAVAQFHDNYERIMRQYNFTPDRIINLDETGISTVLSTPKVIAGRKQRQVGQIVSAERGELVTFCGIITATGSSLPPVYVFPRVHYKDHFLNGAPNGSLGLANRSGWMTSELFIRVLKHIQRLTSSNKNNPILIICDNHESHISIEAVNYCRDNGIVYLSLPPHTSHKLQPLDVGVFGPFKGKLKIAFNDWHIQNVGKTLTIYNIAELSKLAYLETFTPKNIIGGFSKPGIWPINKLVFGDDDFAPIDIFSTGYHDLTDENTHNTQDLHFVDSETSQNNEVVDREQNKTPTLDADPVSVSDADDPLHVSSSKAILTPEVVRPYPKKAITDSVLKRKGREKGRSRIYTETPEKNRLESLRNEKNRKRELQKAKQHAKELKTAKNLLGLTEPKKKKRVTSLPAEIDSDSSQDEVVMTSDSEDIEMPSESEEEVINQEPVNPEHINIGDFLLIKFEKKKTVIHYVAKVVFKYNVTEYEVLYLRKKAGSSKFIFPIVEDKASVDVRDVVLQLPKPTFSKGTSRTSSLYSFSVGLTRYNIQ